MLRGAGPEDFIRAQAHAELGLDLADEADVTDRIPLFDGLGASVIGHGCGREFLGA